MSFGIHTRWWILILAIIDSFTTDFFAEQPSILVQRLTGTAEECTNGTDHCINLDLKQFNLIFSSSAWSCAIAAFLSGLVIDRHGCKVTMLVAAALVFLGSLMFVLGTYSSSTQSAYATLVIGRVISSFGNGATGVITHRMKASWFLYKELALAFSIHVVFGRLGSAVSFNLTGYLVEIIGMQNCLWIGMGFVVLSTIACVALAFLHELGNDMINTSPSKMNSRVVWDFVKSLDGMFWCFTAMVFLSYGTVSTFSANGPNFVAGAYGYSEADASYIVGIIYDISVLAILFGWLTDRYGYREYWLLASALLLFTAFVAESTIPQFPAWLLTTIIGLAYTTFGPTLWSSIPVVVLPASVGSAIGVGKFFQSAGTATLTAIAGAILNLEVITKGPPWEAFVLILLVMSGIAVAVTCLATYLNSRSGYRLTPSQRERERKFALESTPLLQANRGSYAPVAAAMPRTKSLAQILTGE